MMRQAALHCFRSTKKTPKPFWVTNLKTTNASKLITKPNLLTPQFHCRHFGADSSLEFTARRSEPELVTPAKPTPSETKPLSEIDDQEGHRYLYPIIYFYRYHPSMDGKDPAKVIREALAKALVFYYPFSGRLREGPGRKLSVDCTGEGVVFVEADADVELAHFGNPPRPPFPCFDELIGRVPVFEGILNSPLLFIQVTRLKCGGFVLAIRFNHTMSDAQGILQFLSAIADIARGALSPSIIPVWRREIFNARDPPRVTCTHRQYQDSHNTPDIVFFNHPEIIHRSFFLGPSELQTIRNLVPQHMRSTTTTFETLTAFLWRCHTLALQFNPDDEVRLLCTTNLRYLKLNPPVPVGYYGNAITSPAAVTTAGELVRSPIEYALQLVKKAKDEVSEEYVRSLSDLMVIRNRPCYVLERTFIVSDLRRVGLTDVDFGWGKAAYAGPARIESEASTSYIPFRNHKGEDGILVPLCLRARVMDRFERELSNVGKSRM